MTEYSIRREKYLIQLNMHDNESHNCIRIGVNKAPRRNSYSRIGTCKRNTVMQIASPSFMNHPGLKLISILQQKAKS